MKKTIFNVFVYMESQEQCDRMKQLCVDNGLQVDMHIDFFRFIKKYKWFFCDMALKKFAIWGYLYRHYTEVTEAEFMELLNEYKTENGK